MIRIIFLIILLDCLVTMKMYGILDALLLNAGATTRAGTARSTGSAMVAAKRTKIYPSHEPASASSTPWLTFVPSSVSPRLCAYHLYGSDHHAWETLPVPNQVYLHSSLTSVIRKICQRPPN